jgi:hypothetical protein
MNKIERSIAAAAPVEVTGTPPTGPFRIESGHCWIAQLPTQLKSFGDTETAHRASDIVLCEDESPIGVESDRPEAEILRQLGAEGHELTGKPYPWQSDVTACTGVIAIFGVTYSGSTLLSSMLGGHAGEYFEHAGRSPVARCANHS